jgi:dephospho-CoA kinase
MTRDASTLEEASSRLSSQMPIGEKVAYADVVIDNSGSLNDLEVQVDAFVRKLVRHSSSWMGLWWKLCWLIPPVAVLSALWTLSWRSMRRTPKRNS